MTNVLGDKEMHPHEDPKSRTSTAVLPELDIGIAKGKSACAQTAPRSRSEGVTLTSSARGTNAKAHKPKLMPVTRSANHAARRIAILLPRKERAGSLNG
jgi:hypothetical protein